MTLAPVAKVEKSGRETIALTIDRFRDEDCLNVRLCTHGPRGALIPSHAGFTAPLHLIPSLIDGLQKVHQEAATRGLLSVSREEAC